QTSFESSTPFPQYSAAHVAEHPSPSSVSPSSQVSPRSTMPLPHSSADVQVALHPSPLIVLPSSHASLESTIPSPQLGSEQFAWQPSASSVLPSSQASPTSASSTPLPQLSSDRHIAE